MSFQLRDFGLEAFFALVGRRDAGLHVGHIDLALFADGLGERARRHAAAEHVVGGDISDREIGVAGPGLEHAGADEGIDADDRDAGLMRLAQRLDHLHLVIGRDEDGGGLLGDDRFENGHLQRHVPFRGALVDQIDAERLGGGFGALVHGDVESVGGEAGDQRDGDLVLRGGLACGKPGRRGGAGGTEHFDE